jgi:hypothetical protein
MLLLLGGSLAACLVGAAEETGTTSNTLAQRFQETDALFANPGKGWLANQRLPRRQPRFPASVAYFRLNWGDLEPQEKAYRWELIDEAIAAWGKRNVRIAFRIMTTNAHSRGYYCSPQWLFTAGCRSYEYVRGGEDTMAGGKRITRIEPDYGDPIFMAKHGAFVAALARRYDGHAGIEFLDIGSYGIWGEWHTPNGKPWEVRKRILDMYLEGFRKTPLVAMSDDAEALRYAIARGTGFRRDGVGSPWHEKNWIGSKKYAAVDGLADHWRRAPVVFEWFGPYDFLRRRGWPFDRAVDFMLRNHVTYINDNVGPVPGKAMPRLRELARKAGYRFVLREVTYPAAVACGTRCDVTMHWSNVGAGKLYRLHRLVLVLLDREKTIALRQLQDGVDVTAWAPGDHRVAGGIDVPAQLAAGTYTLAVGLNDPARNVPAIRFANETPLTGRYHHIGTIVVE